MKLERLEEISPQSILIVLFLLSLLSFLIIELFPALFYKTMDVASYLVFHNIAEFFSIIVSFSIFGVGWYTFNQSRDRHALFLSTAFLGIGLLDFMHTLSYAGMPAFITPNSANKSTQLWIAARMFTAIVFLASAFIESDSKSRWLTKLNLLAIIFTISGLVFIGIIFYPLYMPATFIENIGLTPFKIYSEYLIISLLILTSAVYWKRFLRTGNRMLIFYIAAFVFCIFSELAFAGYKSVFDTYNVLGHIYKVAAFVLIYYGIFITTVKHPYSVLQLETTERKRAKEKLREASLYTRSLIEVSLDPLVTISPDGKITDVNKATETVTGVSREQLIGSDFLDYFTEPEKAREGYRQVFERGFVKDYPLAIRHTSGSTIDVLYNAAVYKDSSGNVAGVFAAARDITERKKADETLRESEERYRRLVDSSPDGIIVHNMREIEFANPAAAKILGAENPEELIGIPVNQIIHPDYRDFVKERINREKEGKDALLAEEKFLRLDGEAVDVEVMGTPIKYKGNLEVHSVVRDITGRKQAEEMQRKLSSAVEHTADIVVIARKDGTIEYVNPAFEKITGYTMEEAVGKTPRILKSGKQDQKFYEHLWETILSGEVFYGVLINKKNNGELYYAEKTITPVKDEKGIITHFVSTDKDITESKKAEEVHHENLRLEAADKAKSEFLANMSHELRTPLNATIGFSELLKQGAAGELNEKQKHFVDNILASGKHLLNLINDILDLSKVEAGKIELVIEKIPLPETINETLTLINEKAAKHNVLLKREFDPQLVHIEADKLRVKQVLFNLLDNAVKFSKPEGGTVTITTKKDGDMAKISVSDTGIGIKEKDMNKIFQKRHRPGTSHIKASC
ncbi:MAG: PAS domain S-box protein [Candidatus Methanoperedens sp.]|nr:PAS domain S-box protein [Candidatus Methanoperedens sp.]